MPLYAPPPASSKPRPKLPAGSHAARLYSIVDLGTQETNFQGEAKVQRKLRLTWEVPEERAEFDGQDKPLAIGKEFTFSLHEKATLRKAVEGMLGRTLTDADARKLDIETLLGSTCLLSVVLGKGQDGQEYPKISGFGPLMKGMVVKPAENKPVLYSVRDRENEVFATLPQFLQEKIRASREFNAPVEEGDDIPF